MQNLFLGHCTGVCRLGKPLLGSRLSTRGERAGESSAELHLPPGSQEPPGTALPGVGGSLLPWAPSCPPLPPALCLPHCCPWGYLLQPSLKARQKRGFSLFPSPPHSSNSFGKTHTHTEFILQLLTSHCWLKLSSALGGGAIVKQWGLLALPPASASDWETGCIWTWAKLGCPHGALSPRPPEGGQAGSPGVGGQGRFWGGRLEWGEVLFSLPEDRLIFAYTWWRSCWEEGVKNG